MASTSKCPFCGAAVRSDERVCPHCGANNELYVVPPKTMSLPPKTILQLQEYCAQKGMPLLRMRFFIGQNYQGARAFGIYRDGSDFVVYKNKADGSRAIRYRGHDEAYAVRELYNKLLEECHNRGIYPNQKPGSASVTRSASAAGSKGKKTLFTKHSPAFYAFLAMALIFVIIFASQALAHRKDGYYTRNDTLYYRYGSIWYRSGDSWYRSYDPFITSSSDDNYLGPEYDSSWGSSDFKSSSAWDDLHASSSSDHDSSWDYDSWDSWDTDWDSDW